MSKEQLLTEFIMFMNKHDVPEEYWDQYSLGWLSAKIGDPELAMEIDAEAFPDSYEDYEDDESEG